MIRRNLLRGSLWFSQKVNWSNFCYGINLITVPFSKFFKWEIWMYFSIPVRCSIPVCSPCQVGSVYGTWESRFSGWFFYFSAWGLGIWNRSVISFASANGHLEPRSWLYFRTVENVQRKFLWALSWGFRVAILAWNSFRIATCGWLKVVSGLFAGGVLTKVSM